MFERYQNGPTGGDCTAVYTVVVDKEYTLKEFIDTVISKYPDEWGYFRLCSSSIYKPFFVIGYKRGELDTEIPEDLSNRIINCVGAAGGWSNMDYTLRIGGEY